MLLGDFEARHFVQDAYNHGKAIASSGEGSELLQAVGIKSAPGVVMSEKSEGDFSKAFIEGISKHRHWNRPKT